MDLVFLLDGFSASAFTVKCFLFSLLSFMNGSIRIGNLCLLPEWNRLFPRFRLNLSEAGTRTVVYRSNKDTILSLNAAACYTEGPGFDLRLTDIC